MEVTIEQLREKSDDLLNIAMVMSNARDLSEFYDAESAMEKYLEIIGTWLDQVELSDLGFVNGVKKLKDPSEIIARGERIFEAQKDFDDYLYDR